MAACSDDALPPEESVRLVLDIPNAVLDPSGYTSVEITLHEPNGDSVRSADVDADGRFDLGPIAPRDGVWIEATLRNASGAPMGYGRTAGAADFVAGTAITVPIRRPIAYIAGPGLTLADQWIGLPSTFSDLSAGNILDGTTHVGAKPMLMVAAGPRLYAFDQDPNPTTGDLQGAVRITEVSTGTHDAMGTTAAFDGGALQDGAGSDDGTTLVIATSTKLFVLTEAGTPSRPAGGSANLVATDVANGNFSRVAVVARADGGYGAIAIANRAATTGACGAMAELWFIPDLAAPTASRVGTGGFTDVAADSGHAYFVDCNNTLGEVIDGGTQQLRTALATSPSRATALAVSNGQAWVGVERPGMTNVPAVTSLVVTAVANNDPPRTLWTESSQQVLRAVAFRGVERRLDATASTFLQLEIGAGGDYVAATLAASFFGADVDAANFPEMEVVTEELRVFDAATGGSVQRYRSWCEGTFLADQFDIDEWACSVTTGQTEPASLDDEHRVRSMTFLFGKK